jgi:hypothetical protein
MTGTARIPYLDRRRAGFFFRRRIPRARGVSNPQQGSFLHVSLRTHVPSEAKDLARRLTGLSDLAFALAKERHMGHLKHDQNELLEQLARFQIAAHEALRAAAPARSEEAARHAAACEQATQAVLRRALATGDRTPAIAPLREVAGLLGVDLAEHTEDWNVLAFEAVRVLLDVSAARERAELGLHDSPGAVFRSVRSEAFGISNMHMTPAMPGVTPASVPLGVTEAVTRGSPSAHPVPETTPAAHHATILPAASTPVVAAPATPPAAAVTPGLDPEVAARVTARPPLLKNIPLDRLSPEMQQILREKPRGITLEEAFDLMYELKALGLGDAFDMVQELDDKAGARWAKDSVSKIRFGKRYWPEFCGDGAFEEVDPGAIRDAMAFLPQVPAKHSKGIEKWAADLTFQDVAERCDEEREAAIAAKLAELAGNPTATAADREAIELGAGEPRLRAETIAKHRRMVRAVGDMLLKLRLIDENPFEICRVTNKAKKRMQQNEAARARTVWDDRIFDLFLSDVSACGTDLKFS